MFCSKGHNISRFQTDNPGITENEQLNQRKSKRRVSDIQSLQRQQPSLLFFCPNSSVVDWLR